MSARDEAVEMIRRICPAHLSADEYGRILAEKFDTHRAETIAALQGLHDLAPNGRRANQLAFSVGVLMGARDFPAEKQADTEATPDFFQVGHTYTDPDGSTDWRFLCDAITTHPQDGERTALGWRHFRGQWSECAYGEDDWEIHQIADAIATTEESSK
jgi:hypothetical protein